MAVVHQLRAHDGRGSTSAPDVCALKPAHKRPSLYFLSDILNDDGAGHLAAKVTRACVQAYRQAQGSLTGALMAVMRAAETTATKTESGESAAWGLSALTIARGEALLMQWEPAACWLLRDGTLKCWPAESVWHNPRVTNGLLRRLIDEFHSHRLAEPELVRIPLRPGDRLLLATTSVARSLGEFLIAEAMAQDNPAMALHELAPDLDFSALSVSYSGPPPELETEPVPEQAAGVVVEAGGETVKWAAASEPNVQVVADPKPAGFGALARMRAQAIQLRQAVQSLRETITMKAMRPQGERPQSPRLARQARPSQESRPWALPAPLSALRPYFAIAGFTVLLILKVLWFVLRAVLSFLSRSLPERERPATQMAPQARRQMQANPWEGRVLGSLALGIPVVVAFVVLIMREQAGREQIARAVALLDQATNTYQVALGLSGSEARRAELLKASQEVEEVVSLSPKDAAAKELQSKITAELDKLSNVTKFFFYPVLYDFKEKDSRPTVVVARGIDVYVLDAGLNRLYKFLLNDAKDGIQPAPNSVVMRQGDERGAIVVGRLADIFWGMPGGGRSRAGILTLTAARQLVEYVPAKGINVLAVGPAAGWEEATVAETFNGNLYVLDARTNRILKFVPTGDEYKNPPVNYLAADARVDFAGAVDIAIDSFVYVLVADGSILKFDTGNLIPFSKKGLDVPLRKPVAIVAQPNSQNVYVADAGNKRIVQFSKNGEFLRQFKPDEPAVMSDLRGLSVDEASRRFYFVSGSRLYMGALQ